MNTSRNNASGSGSGSGSRNWIPEFPPRKPIIDDISRIGEGVGMGTMLTGRGKESQGEKKKMSGILKRRTHFANADHRREVVFGPEVCVCVCVCFRSFGIFSVFPVFPYFSLNFKPPNQDLLTTDFCYDFLQFNTKGGIGLRLPGGISVDLLRYWDGQPVRFVCCERGSKVHTGIGGIGGIGGGSSESVIGSKNNTGNGGGGGGGGGVNPWGKIYWCVVIESAEDSAFGEKVVC